MQRLFSKAAPLAWLLPPLCVLLFAWLLQLIPDREAIEPRTSLLRFKPVQLDGLGDAPAELLGAWRIASDDPAFGGISALTIDHGTFLAVSDSGVVVSFAKPEGSNGPAFLRELPDGPASARFKRHRDTEALVSDPSREGWWTAFENHDQLWLYDERFERALRRIRFGSGRWHFNTGIEALAASGDELIAFPEDGESLLRIRGSQMLAQSLPAQIGRISDAAALPNGDLLLLERQLTWRGFANALVVLGRRGESFRLERRIALPLGPLDNAEALAVEPLAGGQLRLWVMTDDNFQPPFRTLLVSLVMGGAS